MASSILLGLLLGISGSVAHAGQIFSESFEFGPEVAGRAHVQAGDAFELGAVQEGQGEWNVGPMVQRRRNVPKALEYMQGGGIRFVQAGDREAASLFVQLPAGIDAKTWEATVEFIPGTLWAEDMQTGANGLWFGLVEDGSPRRMFVQIQDAELAVARVWLAGSDGLAALRLIGTSQADESPTKGKTFHIDPEALHRLVLRVDLATRVAEAVLKDEQGAVLAELSRQAPGVQGFNALRIELRSLTFNESGIPPVLKKVVLKTE